MILDTFERYKNNLFLSPISSDTLQTLGKRCGLCAESSVLEIDCGMGGVSVSLAEQFRCMVTGTESRPDFAEEARRRAIFSDVDLLVNILETGQDDLPFDDAFFDLAISLRPPYPYDSGRLALRLARVVRPGGWLALSDLVWKPDTAHAASDTVLEWLDRFAPLKISEMDERKGLFEEEGFQVEWSGLEKDASWESFYAPQARSILENRLEYSDSSEAISTLAHWQDELEMYHSGGGKESLGYACFLLRRS